MISASFDETKSIKRMSSLANVKLGEFKNTKDGIVINWEEVAGADTYRIYRRTVNGNWMALISSATGTSYTDRTAVENVTYYYTCLLYTSPSPRDGLLSRMPSSA